MEDNLTTRLQDALCGASLIQQWTTAEHRDALETDRILRPAIEGEFIIVSEALRIASTFDDDLATKFPQLDEWINYGRHLLTDYRDIDPDDLWRRATIETAVLIQDLERIIQSSS